MEAETEVVIRQATRHKGTKANHKLTPEAAIGDGGNESANVVAALRRRFNSQSSRFSWARKLASRRQ